MQRRPCSCYSWCQLLEKPCVIDAHNKALVFSDTEWWISHFQRFYVKWRLAQKKNKQVSESEQYFSYWGIALCSLAAVYWINKRGHYWICFQKTLLMCRQAACKFSFSKWTSFACFISGFSLSCLSQWLFHEIPLSNAKCSRKGSSL